MKLGEFFIDLSVDSAKGELSVNRLISAMGELEVISVGEVAILAAMADKLAEFSASTIEGAEKFLRYAAATGASTRALEEWRNAASLVGEGDAIAPALTEINRQIEDIVRTGKAGQLVNLKNYAPDVFDTFMKMAAEKDTRHPEKILESLKNSHLFGRSDKGALADQDAVLRYIGISGIGRTLSNQPTIGVPWSEFNRVNQIAGSMTGKQIAEWDRVYRDGKEWMLAMERMGRAFVNLFVQDLDVWLRARTGMVGAVSGFIEGKKGTGELVSTFAPHNVGALVRDIVRGGGPFGWLVASQIPDFGTFPSAFTGVAPLPPRSDAQKIPTIEFHTEVKIDGADLSDKNLDKKIERAVKRANDHTAREVSQNMRDAWQ